jgi:hypothetical protein
MAKFWPQVVSIHHLLISASETTKKLDTRFAQHMIDNRKTKSMEFLTIFYNLDDCASNSSELSLKSYPQEFRTEIEDIIIDSLIYTVA